jgi:hypothetical protein
MSKLFNTPIIKLVDEITIKDLIKLYFAYEITQATLTVISQRMDEARKNKAPKEIHKS